MPALAVVSLLPKAADVASAALGALGIGGETGEDKRRKERAAMLEAAALSGDRAAVLALEFDAFDVRGRSPADVRTPRDGKYSPAAVRDLATKALKRLTAAGVQLSTRERYAQLRVPLPQTQTQEVVRAIVTPIAERFAPDVGGAVAAAARPAINTAVVVGLVVVVVAAVVIFRGARG